MDHDTTNNNTKFENNNKTKKLRASQSFRLVTKYWWLSEYCHTTSLDSRLLLPQSRPLTPTPEQLPLPCPFSLSKDEERYEL